MNKSLEALLISFAFLVLWAYIQVALSILEFNSPIFGAVAVSMPKGGAFTTVVDCFISFLIFWKVRREGSADTQSPNKG